MIKPFAIDVGRNMGWCVMGESGAFKFKTLKTFYSFALKTIVKNKCNLIITGIPVKNHLAIAQHNRYMGILEMLAEELGIAYVEITDSTAKKTVLGHGHTKKPKIKEWAEKRFKKEMKQDEADACMFYAHAILTFSG